MPAALQCRSSRDPGDLRDAHESRPFADFEDERVGGGQRHQLGRLLQLVREPLQHRDGEAAEPVRAERPDAQAEQGAARLEVVPDRDSSPCSQSVIRMRSAVVLGMLSRRATSDEESGDSASTKSSSASQARARLGMR